MNLESVVHRLVDVAAGLDRIGAHEAPALHEAIDAKPAEDAPAAEQTPSADSPVWPAP